MECLDSSAIGSIDDRHNRRLYLGSDFICLNCGVIFNSCYQEDCVICEIHDYVHDCGCNEYVTGKLSISIRSVLDFNIDDLKALNSIYGYNSSSRTKMVVNIISSMYPDLDKRINDRFIKKIILRNSRKFSFLRDIDAAMKNVKKARTSSYSINRFVKLNFVDADDIIINDSDTDKDSI